MHNDIHLGCISLLLPGLTKLPSQCYSNESDNLGNLGSNKEIQPNLPYSTIIQDQNTSTSSLFHCLVYTALPTVSLIVSVEAYHQQSAD